MALSSPRMPSARTGSCSTSGRPPRRPRRAPAGARRAAAVRVGFEILAAPDTYVAGEESAAVHFVNAADARPTVTPPRPYERGIDGRPTLVQNVESLAQAALIARFGDGWYREVGRNATPGSALVTISGASRDGVREVEIGTTIGQLAGEAGAGDRPGDRQAVLLGGYFGGWLSAERGWDVPLDPIALRSAGSAFGAGRAQGESDPKRARAGSCIAGGSPAPASPASWPIVVPISTSRTPSRLAPLMGARALGGVASRPTSRSPGVAKIGR